VRHHLDAVARSLCPCGRFRAGPRNQKPFGWFVVDVLLFPQLGPARGAAPNLGSFGLIQLCDFCRFLTEQRKFSDRAYKPSCGPPGRRRAESTVPGWRAIGEVNGPRPKTRPNNIGLPERNIPNGRVTDSTGTMVFGCNLATRLARFGRLLAFFGVGAREIADTFRGLQVPPASQPGPRQCDRLGDSC
jgi:hypothetical protein